MYFWEKYKNRIIVAGVTIILLIVMGFTNTDRTKLTKAEKLVGNVVSPINKVTFNARKKTSDFFSVIKNLSTILAENEELKREVAELEEKNREQENIIGKFDYLKKEAELMDNTKHTLIGAQIISKEPGNWYNRFMIDKGLKDGIKKNDTVVQGIESENNVIQEGLVGRVYDVGDNWAKVAATIDGLNNISFKITRTQDGGVISGGPDNKLQGILYDNSIDVLVGDKVYTSGLGGIFKKDIYIGEVSEVIEQEDELIKKILVKPSVDFKKIYKVFIIAD